MEDMIPSTNNSLAAHATTDLHSLSYILFAFLVLICVVLHMWARQTKSHISSGNNPNFIHFQHRFLIVYFLALFSDWLQGPYIYKLYSYYGFAGSQIAVLYVVGFAASVLFGTGTGIMADRFGRKKLCVTFCVIYSLCCLTKLSSNFNILLLGRIFGGVATSMLFSTFESWYVYEHVERNDFPTEWLPVSFSKITFWNGILAIQAGIAANVLVDEFHFGPVSPFMLAIPFLIAAGFFMWFTWPENYGDLNARFCVSCKSGLQVILQNEKIFLLGAVQSLFESVMYMFVFLWTPILDPLNPPLGMIFSCFMVCIMIGSSCYEILLSKDFSSANTLTIAVFLSLVSMFICIFSTNVTNPHILLSLFAFLLLEVSVGLYFPSIGFLRSRIIPESHRANVMNWFRAPMNIITCSGLLWLHHGHQSIFIICTVLMGIGLLIMRWLEKRLDKEECKNVLISQES